MKTNNCDDNVKLYSNIYFTSIVALQNIKSGELSCTKAQHVSELPRLHSPARRHLHGGRLRLASAMRQQPIE